MERSPAGPQAGPAAGGAGPDGGLRAAVAGLARILLRDTAVTAVADQVVALAARHLSGTEAAALTLLPAGAAGPSVTAASDAVRLLHEIQRGTGRGPFLDVVATGTRLNAVLTPDPRWPEFTAAAVEQGWRSLLVTPLRAGGETLGAFGLFSRLEAAFGRAEVEATEAYALAAATVLANALALGAAGRTAEELRASLATRDVIGQAQGILMVRRRCSAAAAFDVLRDASQRSNRKLRDVAREVVAAQEQEAL
jgi:GAF domain-containing protein